MEGFQRDIDVVLRSESYGKEEIIGKLFNILLDSLSQGKTTQATQILFFLKSLKSCDLISDTTNFINLVEAAKILPSRYSAELMILLKSMGLLNMITRKISLTGNSSLLMTIRAIDSKFSTALGRSDFKHTFWLCKGKYSVTVLDIVFEIEKYLTETGSNLNSFFTDAASIDLLYDSLNNNIESINQLFSMGISRMISTIKKKSVKFREMNNIIAEVFNYVISNFNFDHNYVPNIVDDIILLFNGEKNKYTKTNDWVLLHTFIEILLNIARVSTIDIATKILVFFKNRFYNKSNGSWRVSASSLIENQIVKSNKIMVKTKLIEAIALMAQIPLTDIFSKNCFDFIRECWSCREEWKLPLQCVDCLNSVLIFENKDFLTEDLLQIPSWKQSVSRLIQNTIQNHQNFLRFPLLSSTKYYISDEVADELKSALPDVHRKLTAISGGLDTYWPFFCLSLLIEYELHITANPDAIPNVLDIPDLPQISLVQNRAVKSVWGYEDYILSLPQSASKEDIIWPLVIPIVDGESNRRKSQESFSAVDFLETDQNTDSLDTESRIALIRYIVDQCEKVIKVAKDKNIVMVIGATGSGKSTTLNWLLGCTMVLNANTGSITVKPRIEGGVYDEFCPIGNNLTVSKTIVPSIFELVDNLYLCDAPGFLESRSPEISISNSVNTISVITAANSVGFLLLFSVYELLAAKANAAKESLIALQRMFGSSISSQDGLQRYSYCILLGITHATNYQFVQAKNILSELCKPMNLSIPVENIIHIDPIEGQQGCMMKTDLQANLNQMQKILKNETHHVFTTPALNEKDIALITVIANQLRISCEESWNKKQVINIVDSFLLLQSLSMIGRHLSIAEEIVALREFIIKCVQDYININIMDVIRLPLSDVHRTTIFANMNFLTSLTTLDICFPSNSVSLLIEVTKAKVFHIEQEELSTRNIRLSDIMNTMLQELSNQLDNLLINRSECLASLDFTDNFDNIVCHLQDALPILIHILSFKAGLSKELHGRVSLFMHTCNSQKVLDEMIQSIENSIGQMVEQRILPAKIQNLSNYIISQIKVFSDYINISMEKLHTPLLSLNLKIEQSTEEFKTMEKLLEFRLESLLSADLGLDQTVKNPILSSFSNLQKIFHRIHENKGVTDFYNKVIQVMEDFWANIMSQAIILEKNSFSSNLQSIQTKFSDATIQQRTLATNFNFDFLLSFSLLANHVNMISQSLTLLPNSKEVETRVANILGTLESDMHKTVCKNLSFDLIVATDKFLQNMDIMTNRDTLGSCVLELQKVDMKHLSILIMEVTKKHIDIIEAEVHKAVTKPFPLYPEIVAKIINRLNRFRELFQLAGIPLSEDYIQYQSILSERLQACEKLELDNASVKIKESSESIKRSLKVGLESFIQRNSNPADNPESLADPVTATKMLLMANYISIDVVQTIIDMDTLAQTTEQALVLTKLESVTLKESVQQLKQDIKHILNEGHNSHVCELDVSRFKAKIAILISLLVQTLGINAQFLCAENELTLQYLAQRDDYQLKANEIILAAKNVPPSIRSQLSQELVISFATIRTQATVLFSEQMYNPISDWIIDKTIGAHVDEIIEKFNILQKLGNLEIYKIKITLFMKQCNSMQSKENIDNMMSSNSFTSIFSLRNLLLEIKYKMKHHNFELELTSLHDAIANFMENKYRLAINEVECPPISKDFLDFTNLKEFMKISHLIRSIHKDGLPQLKVRAKVVFDEFFSQENNQRLLDLSVQQRDRTEAENRVLEHTAKQFAKYFAVATELSMKPDFIRNIGGVLGRIRGPATDTLSQLIYELQSDNKLSEVCGDILSSFKVFSRVNIERQNALASGVTFTLALERLVSTPSVDKEVLRTAKIAFDEVYETCLTNIDGNCYDCYTQQQDMEFLSDNLKDYRFELSRQPEAAAKLVALVCAHFCYIDSKDTYYNVGNKNKLFKMHDTQVLAIFLILGLDTPGPVKGRINEILTGEGKSIVLAMIATVYALLDVNTKIVCYSSYLTHKDNQIFDGFFTSLNITNRITYCTISNLVNAVMKKSFPDLRSQVRSFLKGESVREFKGIVGTEVILIDEVDIFFGEDFYGAQSDPVFLLNSAEAIAFMKYMWTNRLELIAQSSKEAVSTVNTAASDIIECLCESYPRLRSLLPSIIKRCRRALSKYHSTPQKSKFECIIQYDKVGQMDSKSGEIKYRKNFDAIFEYFFQYERQQANGEPYISAESVASNVGINIRCGRVLYAELPKLFRVVHGVSGTLAYFQEEQNAILANYGLERRSSIPTTYTKAPLKVIPTTIYSGDRDDLYFDKVKEILSEMVLKRRATLVFFDTIELLNSFLKQLKKQPIDSVIYEEPEILSEYLSDQQRDFVINRVTNAGKITLSTKMFMRGTDFICRDSQLRCNGGVHVVLTFYPESEADDVQARGRTCRQNDPGSFQMILFAQDLVDRELLRTRKEGGENVPDFSETDQFVLNSEEAVNRIDIFLNKKRRGKSALSAEHIFEKLEKNTPNHLNTLRMSQEMAQGNVDEAARILVEFQT